MTCYHIWHLSQTGGAFFRFRKCYQRRPAAVSAVRRWREHAPNDRGRRPAPGTGVFMIRQCDGDPCPCDCRRL